MRVTTVIGMDVNNNNGKAACPMKNENIDDSTKYQL